MASFDPQDKTPIVGSHADIAPLGRSTPKPAHEQTADEERNLADWDGIAAMPEFQELLAKKLRFIIPCTVFFLVYYFALPYLVGYHKAFMNQRIGPVNLAYLFALSQFFMAWIMAALYVKVASGWDKDAAAIIAKSKGGK